MASDDRPTDRPDDAPRRFSLRRFLTPDDDAGDGTSADLSAESFGTGDLDDDALDAVVQEATSDDAPSFVWPAEHVSEFDAVPPDAVDVGPIDEATLVTEEPVAETLDPDAMGTREADGSSDAGSDDPAVEAMGSWEPGPTADPESMAEPTSDAPEEPTASWDSDAPLSDMEASTWTLAESDPPADDASMADGYHEGAPDPTDEAPLVDAADEPDVDEVDPEAAVPEATLAEDEGVAEEPAHGLGEAVTGEADEDAPWTETASAADEWADADAVPAVEAVVEMDATADTDVTEGEGGTVEADSDLVMEADGDMDSEAATESETAWLATDAVRDDDVETMSVAADEDTYDGAEADTVGAMDEIVEPEEEGPIIEAATPDSEAPDAEMPDEEPEEAMAFETGASDPEASEDEGVQAAADATALVDEAFDEETDLAKADGVGMDGVEGDLDVASLGPDDFEPEDLKGVLRTMMLSRRLDEKMLTLLKQGKGFFHIGSSGHEASQAAVAREFEGGRDWFCFYYRDLATALTIGLTPAEVLRAHFGKADDPFGGGRQMPEHFGHRDLNILSTSSSVGAQYVPAVGFALAVKREDTDGGPTRAVYASGGEGSTSQGAFHEALNWAAREALPVLFHIQDNKYAISVPVEEQTAGGSIWHLLGGYAGLRRLRYDGTDFFESAAAARAAMAHIRAGGGPVALHADVVRLLPHSSSDDHKKYRAAEALEADRARDPIPRFAARLVEAGLLSDDDVEAMRAEVAAEVDRLAKEIEKEADPDPATATAHVYFEGDDDRQYEAEGEVGELIVMVDAINHALDEEMDRDERVLVYGEDVGGGKGGVFTATRGLTEKHGRERCFNSPLAEHSIIGSAVGLACAGYKPVVEIQFADYIWPGMQQLRNQVASMRYRSNGAWANPMVLRVPCGGYIHGGLCHSQNVEAMFAHWPGLQVVMPSNAADAKGLLKAAIRGQDPVIFLEHKALYRQGPARRPEPHADYLVPLGKAAVTREGADLTIVTWGAIVYKALNVAKALEKEGVSVEVIDVRSMMPFDSETIVASARKTGRVLVAYEDHEFMGFGAEIAAQVSDAAFGHLDAPVKRVAGAFSSIPYADVLEQKVLPQDDDVLAAARDLLAY